MHFKEEKTEFVDLNRRFYIAIDQNKPEDAAQESYMVDLLDRKKGLNWPDILMNRLVVVLGEPGSGKSSEFKFQVDKLRGQSELAFYIPLQRLVYEPLSAILGEHERRAFQRWKDGNSTAYFFFDAVDESKFKQSNDFLTALDRISNTLNDKELRRAKILFSSRIFEWRPVTDSHALRRRFAIAIVQENEEKISETDNNNSIFEDRANITHEVHRGNDKSIDDPVVVHLAPLNHEQVRVFTQFRGLSDPDAFIQSLDDHYAWEFARRPLDVDWLIEYWRENKRLGSLTELIEHSLKHFLRETESREKQYPLTPERAREGAGLWLLLQYYAAT